MAQLLGGSPDVGAHSLRDQRAGLLPWRRGKQRLHRGTDPVDDGTQIGRLLRRGLLELLHGGQDRSALRVSQHHRQSRPEPPGGKLDAPHLGRCHDVSRDSDHEQVSKPLPEHQLRRNARVGTPQDDGKRLLRAGGREPTSLVAWRGGII